MYQAVNRQAHRPPGRSGPHSLARGDSYREAAAGANVSSMPDVWSRLAGSVDCHAQAAASGPAGEDRGDIRSTSPAATAGAAPSTPGVAPRQRGVALITAMLVVAIATVLAADSAFRQQIEIQRTASLLERDQARLYAHALEDWSAVILREDAQDSQVDHLGEDWAQQIPFLAIDNGSLAGGLVDQQGRLNANNLVQGDAVDPLALERFNRLLTNLEVPRAVTDALIDWIDPDSETTGAGGAEDDYYSRQDPPYRAANRPLRSISELRLLRGVDEEIYRRLQPYLSALPQATPVNVNTAPAEVLLALAPRLSRADAEAIAERQQDEGFASVDEFLAQYQDQETPIAPETLSVTSRYFLMRADIRFADLRLFATSLLERNEQSGARVLYRSYARDATRFEPSS